MEIDLKYLKDNHLSPDEYVALRLIKDKEFEDLSVFDITVSYKRELINFLVVNGYIIDIGNPLHWEYDKLLLTKKSLDLFKTKDEDTFTRLWNTYPSKVPNGKGGYRVLKPISCDSELFKLHKAKYKAYVKGRPELEEKMYLALTTQLEMEKNSLMYFQNFQTWWNQHTFEKYFDLEAEKELEEKRL